jgi:lipid-binding SYLF domain-containing protein
MKRFVAAVAVLVGMTGWAGAQDTNQKLGERIEDAHEVLHELMATPDQGIPLNIAAKARCVAVIPGFKKGAFLVGAQYGQGVATCRTETGWSAPVFLQITGASFGLQAGGQSTDLVLVGVNRHSLEDLLKEHVKLGGDIAVAAGPVGRDSQASASVLLNAEFLTYSRSKGVFAGVDLTGDEVHQNTKDTVAFYGRDISSKRILSGRVATPEPAAHFIKTVNEMFRRGRARRRR